MSARESKSGELHVSVGGSGAVRDAGGAARAFADGRGLAKSDVSRLCVIIEELVANLYDHGGVAPSDSVELSLSGDPRGVRIILSDPGRSFDPRSVASSGPVPDRGGGAGVRFVQAWTEFVDYRTETGKNRLELIMPRTGSESAPSPAAG